MEVINDITAKKEVNIYIDGENLPLGYEKYTEEQKENKE